MKRVTHFLPAVLIFLLCSLNFNQSVNAQPLTYEQPVTQVGDLTLGAGLSYGTSVGHLGNSEIGVTLQLYYGIIEEVRAGVEYTYYFIGENKLGASEFNLNGHYFIRNRDNLIIYGLGGLNLSRINADSDVWGNISSSDIGLNAGIGLEYDFGNFSLFAEPKFTLGGWNQFMTTVGAKLRI